MNSPFVCAFVYEIVCGKGKGRAGGEVNSRQIPTSAPTVRFAALVDF